jgi:hypothetical protein
LVGHPARPILEFHVKPEITEFDPAAHAEMMAAPCSVTLTNAEWDRVWEVLCAARDSAPDPQIESIILQLEASGP